MLDYENELEYNNYYKDEINKNVDLDLSHRMLTLQEEYNKLQQKYDKLYRICNNYYQNYMLDV